MRQIYSSLNLYSKTASVLRDASKTIQTMEILLQFSEECLAWMDYNYPNHPGYGTRKQVLNDIQKFWSESK